jgi:hypothetical protein
MLAGLPICAAAIVALSFFSFFPGVANPDTSAEYLAALSGEYADWHPPIMAAVWRLVLMLVPGKTGLFLVFALAYAGAALGLASVAARVSWLAVVLVVCVLLSPPFVSGGIMLYKDFLMACVLGCAAASAFQSHRITGGSRAIWIALGLALACTGALLRANGPLGAAPIIVYIVGSRRVATAGWSCLRLPAMAVLLAAAMVPANALVNRVAFHPRSMSVVNQLLIFDFAGIAYFSGENVFPVPVRPDFTLADNAVCYSARWWDWFVSWRELRRDRFGPTASVNFPGGTDDPAFAVCPQVWRVMRREALEHDRSFLADWASAVLHHPVAYAAHRISHFNASLQLMTTTDGLVMRTLEFRNEFGWSFNPGAFGRGFIRAASFLASTPLSWPFVALVAAVVTFFSTGRVQDAGSRRFIVALSCAGWLYAGGFLVAGIADGARYYAWTFLAAGVSSVMLLAEAVRRGMWRDLMLRYALWLGPAVALATAWRYWQLAPPYLLLG